MIETDCIFCQDYLEMPVVQKFQKTFGGSDDVVQSLIDWYHKHDHKFGGMNVESDPSNADEDL